MNLACVAGGFACLLGALTMAEIPGKPLLEFSKPEAVNEWLAVNDGVMGGVSQGAFRLTDHKTLEFHGTLSLENNGGFSSIRTRARNLGLAQGDILVVKVRGDGRDYSLNLYLNRPLMAFSYRAPVATKKDAWVEIQIPLNSFEATSFGRLVKNAGLVKPEEVNALGFMLSDKKPGPFKLEIESIHLKKSEK